MRNVNVPSTFPVENRPIYYWPVARVTAKTYQNVLPQLAESVNSIIDHYRTDRILVHTVSYRLANDLKQRINNPRIITYQHAQERDETIAKHHERSDSVLLAASLDRGYDGADDLARAVIVTKLPYPNLGDAQISARLHSKGGEMWYQVQTIRSLIQMTGRGIRSATDQCDTWILDGSFDTLQKKRKHLFPGWWLDAITRQTPTI